MTVRVSDHNNGIGSGNVGIDHASAASGVSTLLNQNLQDLTLKINENECDDVCDVSNNDNVNDDITKGQRCERDLNSVRNFSSDNVCDDYDDECDELQLEQNITDTRVAAGLHWRDPLSGGEDETKPKMKQDDQSTTRRAIDLCAGCGGMAQATRLLGYHHDLLIDENPRCINTLRANGFTNLRCASIRDVDFTVYEGVELLTAGLPCQPWSTGGKMKGERDSRNLWSEAIRAVREVKPTFLLFEMVTGFLAPAFAATKLQLVAELEKLGYTVALQKVNAKHYGLPQSRRRCLIMGRRHSEPIVPPAIQKEVTVREAINDLGTPSGVNRHCIEGKASSYDGHQPSTLDSPSKTVRAGTHGPGGGSNTIQMDDQTIRYFTIRELARLQGFPDTYQFDPVWSHAVKEIGNACPVPLLETWLHALCNPTLVVEGVTTNAAPDSEPNPSDEGVVRPDPSDEGVTGESSEEGLARLHGEASKGMHLVHLLGAEVYVLQKQLNTALFELPAFPSYGNALAKTVKAKVGYRTDDHDGICQALATDVIYHINRRSGVETAVKECAVNSSHPSGGRSGTSASWRVRPRCNQPRQLVDEQLVRSHQACKKTLKTTEELAELMLCLSKAQNSQRNRMTDYHEKRREVYNLHLDEQTREEPDLGLPKERTIFLKVPRWSLEESEASPDKTTGAATKTDEWLDFYHKEAILSTKAGVDADDDDDDIPYQSMRATLEFSDDQGTSTKIDSVVDSGAAWCGMRFATFKKRFPHLVNQLVASSLRFRDASGNSMDLMGKIFLNITLGSKAYRTSVHIFRKLGAEFLLGTNALRRHRCIIDCNKGTLYTAGDEDHGVPIRAESCRACDTMVANSRKSLFAISCCPAHTKPTGRGCHVLCDTNSHQLVVTDENGVKHQIQCKRPVTLPEESGPRARLVIDQDITIAPGQRLVLDPRLVGVPEGNALLGDSKAGVVPPKDVKMFPSRKITGAGLLAQVTYQNPFSVSGAASDLRKPFVVTNPESAQPVFLEAGTTVAVESLEPEDDSEMVTIALVLEKPEPPPALPSDGDIPKYEEGGEALLKARGFSLDQSIDPELRRPDGTYEPLSEERKAILGNRALRNFQVWSVDAKTPKISLLQILGVPTGDAPAQAQSAYPIAAKLRPAAMKEIKTLLDAGLIEPSMSDWCSPALIVMKKDSELDSEGNPTKIKFAIDYRRVNAHTQIDAGGLGTQSDILYGVGGRYRFLGLCDAAGGFYQYLLDPKDRHKTAFILPASMGGTLFQWRVAPYGLTRNPAGYSRGMQWTLKGMHDLRNLDFSRGRGGASSWLDDICMRATSFDAFVDLFDRMLERMAISQITLKGSKCELLHAEMDLLGFVATPEGLMMQRPKLKKLMSEGIPTTPNEAKSFLGAVAFLRRFIPRISLLGAPMTAAVKSCTLRRAKLGGPKASNRQARSIPFNDREQEAVTQSWNAIMDHLDEGAIVCSPDFEDPLAHFVMCTDSSDFAVGGVLMQWQRDYTTLSNRSANEGPPPPPPKGEDPLDSDWRARNGWSLKIIGYYSKTLDPAQKNYPIFDKEAGAILLCVRHWSDLISYHPTTVYTDSSVAASMLTKHAAPPRLQRWGLELGSYLPHMRIAFRRGTDNGLADLLSRYQVFKNYHGQPVGDQVTLPDDLFDKVGDAPLFNPALFKHHQRTVDVRVDEDREYLRASTYELYEPKQRVPVNDPIWSSPDGKPIPGRGGADQEEDHEVETFLMDMASTQDCHQDTLVALHVLGEYLTKDSSQSDPDSVMTLFDDLHNRPCSIQLHTADYGTDELCTQLIASGYDAKSSDGELTVGEPPDIRVWVNKLPEEKLRDVVDICLSSASYWEPSSCITMGGRVWSVAETDGLPRSHAISGYYAPPTQLLTILKESVSRLLDSRFGARVVQDTDGDEICPVNCVPGGYPRRLEFNSMMPLHTDQHDKDVTNSAVPSQPRTFSWQDRESREDSDSVPVIEDIVEPTMTLTLEEQMRDPKLRLIISALKGDRRTPKRTYDRLSDGYELLPDALYYHVVKNHQPGYALVVPSFMRGSILSRYHYSLGDGAGHSGGETLFEQVSRDYYWPGMRDECEAFVAACEHCGGTRSQATIGAPAGVAPTPTRAFEVIHVDHKSVSMCQGYTSILAVVCALTKFTLYIPVKRTTGEETLTALIDHVFSVFGCPLVIISDNGTSFANALMSASSELFGFRWIFVVPHTPQANGLAEAAVKKVKLLLDRHTSEYQNWVPKVKLFQMAVNQRLTNGMETPFAGVFGQAPVTLAALENPELLPQATAEEASVRQTAITISKIQQRLHEQNKLFKKATALADSHQTSKRRPIPGDKVWLIYSDPERARYIRKHGHGRPWRHPFVVSAVKPHAVRLEIPTDGSVPAVLPWQSLRKCSFAAPHFHDPQLLLPDVNEKGLPMMPEEEDGQEAGASAPSPAPLDDPNAEYPIERIVSATKAGRGWSLQVKWEGYPDATKEPLWKVLAQTNHPDVLKDIERCKQDYYLQHPTAKQADILDFGDVSLVDVSALPSPSSILHVTKLIRGRRRAMRFLDIIAMD